MHFSRHLSSRVFALLIAATLSACVSTAFEPNGDSQTIPSWSGLGYSTYGQFLRGPGGVVVYGRVCRTAANVPNGSRRAKLELVGSDGATLASGEAPLSHALGNRRGGSGCALFNFRAPWQLSDTDVIRLRPD